MAAGGPSPWGEGFGCCPSCAPAERNSDKSDDQYNLATGLPFCEAPDSPGALPQVVSLVRHFENPFVDPRTPSDFGPAGRMHVMLLSYLIVGKNVPAAMLSEQR